MEIFRFDGSPSGACARCDRTRTERKYGEKMRVIGVEYEDKNERIRVLKSPWGDRKKILELDTVLPANSNTVCVTYLMR